MAAAWEVARSSGMWWPFENVAILSDRPSDIHVNERKLLQRGDGPAATYRDGWLVYAWNGKAVPEKWILQPEAVPPRDLKGFDPTFRAYVQSRVGKPAAKTKRAKPGSILEAVLAADHAARLEQLRAHAGGSLPFLDRYLAGEHTQVWAGLVALGADVRADPHAADALAVAYETMRRVDANVRTLVQRLTAMQYTFTPDPTSHRASAPPPEGVTRIDLGGLLNMMLKARDMLSAQTKATPQSSRDAAARAHVPPTPNVRKDIADFEKQFGAMPLSLRAFYEVVGEVNLIG